MGTGASTVERIVALTVLWAAPALVVLHAQEAPPREVHLITLPSSFPAGTYTPHGYIDNPHHSAVLNRSGVLRSFPPLGFGWWRADFPGNYGHTSASVNYVSLLQMSAMLNGTLFASGEDFVRAGARLTSAYHTKHVMSYDWQWGSVRLRFLFFLPRENTLACRIELSNAGSASAEVILGATHRYAIGESPWWGSDGLTGRCDPHTDACISKIWAYGDVFVLSSSLQSLGGAVTFDGRRWTEWLRGRDRDIPHVATGKKCGPLFSGLRYKVVVPPGGSSAGNILLCRGKRERDALEELKQAKQTALSVLQAQLAADEAFWSSCPVLSGDWPQTWKHGWVYDFETLRMTVRPPLGIFHHPWDGMQIHSPRLVLGETSLDMMMLNYADPALAKEVLYGTFADALAPNVPCAREDGSVNMVSADGSECGTAPMWGLPFHALRAIHLSSGDQQWVRRLYPHLREYIAWWLENRTDSAGWLHCNNSWESGQDGSRRFLGAEGNEGAVASFVRTVDVEASMAEAMQIMAGIAPDAGHAGDTASWCAQAARRVANTRAMFFGDWYRDVNGRTGQPIIIPDYYDVMMLTPLACGIASADQRDAVRSRFGYFLRHPEPTLEWPPLLYVFAEAAWNAGERMAASEAVAQVAARVYRRTDSLGLLFADPTDPLCYRVPGVANEFWPVKERVPGGENYGWGATLPMNILRSVIGFREKGESAGREFFLAPTLARQLLMPGKCYGVRNLHFREISLNVSCECLAGDSLRVIVDARAPEAGRLSASRERGGSITSEQGSNVRIIFLAANGDVFLMRWE